MPYNVHIVDDDESVLSFLMFSLKGEGFNVLEARDAETGLATLTKQTPDLILLDINFPPDSATVGGSLRDGYWALEWMHYRDQIKDVPIVIISGDDPTAAQPHATAAGAAAYVQKPINNDALAALISELIARKSAA